MATTETTAMGVVVEHLNAMESTARWAFVRWLYERYDAGKRRPVAPTPEPVPLENPAWPGHLALRRLRGERSAVLMADVLREMFGLPIDAQAVLRWESGLTKPQLRYRIKLDELISAFEECDEEALPVNAGATPVVEAQSESAPSLSSSTGCPPPGDYT